MIIDINKLEVGLMNLANVTLVRILPSPMGALISKRGHIFLQLQQGEITRDLCDCSVGINEGDCGMVSDSVTRFQP